MDLLPVYEKSSEELLNKSVNIKVMQIKLNPQNGDCWNVLAHILFKKGDYEGASKAVNMAIQTVLAILKNRKAKIRCPCVISPYCSEPKEVRHFLRQNFQNKE